MDREQFKAILTSTGRKGVEQVIAKLNELGFFEAPASTRFHLSCKGGLLEHSMNVYQAAVMLREQAIKARPELDEQLPIDSVAICTLLHDVCKTDIYKEGILSRKNSDGYWEKYLGYQVDYNAGLPLGKPAARSADRARRAAESRDDEGRVSPFRRRRGNRADPPLREGGAGRRRGMPRRAADGRGARRAVFPQPRAGDRRRSRAPDGGGPPRPAARRLSRHI